MEQGTRQFDSRLFMSAWDFGMPYHLHVYIDECYPEQGLCGEVEVRYKRWSLRRTGGCGCDEPIAEGRADTPEEAMRHCDEAALAYLAVRLAFRAVQWQRDIDAELACAYRRAMEGLIGEDGYLVRSTLDFEVAEHNLSEGYPVWQREPNSRGNVPNGT